MAQAVETVEGWYILHDFRKINWQQYGDMPDYEKQNLLKSTIDHIKTMQSNEEQNAGSFAIYNVIGHKADLMTMTLRPSLQELLSIEKSFNQSPLAKISEQTYSYFSVVELSNYLVKQHGGNTADPYIQSRLKPKLPGKKYSCFYPMNKKRDGDDNWYALPMESRVKMMRQHGSTGKNYSQQVTQLVSGSVGFDLWEWGITLFADDLLLFKKLVYEMRFDEVSARFGQFGDFFVGQLMQLDDINKYFKD